MPKTHAKTRDPARPPKRIANPWRRAVYGRQRPVNFRKTILSLYLLLFAGLGVSGSYLLLDARHEYARLEQVEAQNRQRLAEAQERLRQQERVLERLRSDPEYVDKVIRKKLGYAKPDEFIYRFEE
jgi:cell division protein DivIC